MTTKEGTTKTLYDIIQAKINSKLVDAEVALSTVDPNEFNVGLFYYRKQCLIEYIVS